MAETLDIIKARRSCRAYKQDAVPEDVLSKILEAGTWAATGMGKQSPVIVCVTDRAKRDALAKMNAAVIGADSDTFYGAPVVVAVLADKEIPTHLYDGTLVLGNIMLAAQDLGVASCYIFRAKEEFQTDEGRAFLQDAGIDPDRYEGIGHVVLGYAAEPPMEAKPRKEDYIRRV